MFAEKSFAFQVSINRPSLYIKIVFFRIEVSALKTANLANVEPNQEECESRPVAAEQLPLVSVDHDQGADDAGMRVFCFLNIRETLIFKIQFANYLTSMKMEKSQRRFEVQ